MQQKAVWRFSHNVTLLGHLRIVKCRLAVLYGRFYFLYRILHFTDISRYFFFFSNQFLNRFAVQLSAAVPLHLLLFLSLNPAANLTRNLATWSWLCPNLSHVHKSLLENNFNQTPWRDCCNLTLKCNWTHPCPLCAGDHDTRSVCYKKISVILMLGSIS